MQEKIRRLLSQGGETQSTLAQRFGVSQSTVHRWYTGSSDPGGYHRDMINGHYAAIFSEISGDKQILDEAEVAYFLGRISGLTDEDIRFLVKSIKGSLIANGAEPLRTRPHDQSQPATPRREVEPSEPKLQRSTS